MRLYMSSKNGLIIINVSKAPLTSRVCLCVSFGPFSIILYPQCACLSHAITYYLDVGQNASHFDSIPTTSHVQKRGIIRYECCVPFIVNVDGPPCASLPPVQLPFAIESLSEWWRKEFSFLKLFRNILLKWLFRVRALVLLFPPSSL